MQEISLSDTISAEFTKVIHINMINIIYKFYITEPTYTSNFTSFFNTLKNSYIYNETLPQKHLKLITKLVTELNLVFNLNSDETIKLLGLLLIRADIRLLIDAVVFLYENKL